MKHYKIIFETDLLFEANLTPIGQWKSTKIKKYLCILESNLSFEDQHYYAQTFVEELGYEQITRS